MNKKIGNVLQRFFKSLGGVGSHSSDKFRPESLCVCREQMKRGRKEKDVPTSSKKESNEQRSTKRHVFLSVGDILSDELTELSLKHWAGDNPEPFDLKLVADIYTKHISNGDLRSVQLLEMSKYLEA